jgi:putative holliday junction resolvase
VGRILSIDYGEKRIGLAISDPFNMTAQPLEKVYNSMKVFQEIKKVAESYEVETVLVGLPKNRDGSDSKKAAFVREFATELEHYIKAEFKFVDERFSTVAAERHLIAADVSRKKRKNVIDSQAAAFFLQGYLDGL